MTSTESDAPAPPPPPPQPTPGQRNGSIQPRDKILGGVAGLIGRRLGIDPMWLRIGFVVLALGGGIGIVLYVGLWLILVVGRMAGLGFLRVVGALVLLFGLPAFGGFWEAGTTGRRGLWGLAQDLRGAPLALLVLLLAGLAVSLWKQPVRPGATDRTWADSASIAPVHAPTREPSLLGRAALGLATTVAAVGALIDLANGGRMHPEQWLGAAAVLCGIGLAIGVVRGTARWLILPALMFAGIGFGAGLVTQVGAPATVFDDRSVTVYAGDQSRITDAGTTVGDVTVSVDGAPASPSTVIATVAFGDVRVWVNSDVSVDVRVRTDHGVLLVDGERRSDASSVRVGPEGVADVVVSGRVGYGDVIVTTYAMTPEAFPPMTTIVMPPSVTTPGIGQPTPVTDGVSITADGLIVLADGEAIIDTDDMLIVGSGIDSGDGRTFIQTGYGEFTLLPRSLMLTPTGQLLDLAVVRSTNVGAVPPSFDPAVTTSTVAATPDATVITADAATTTAPATTAAGATTTLPATTTTIIGG